MQPKTSLNKTDETQHKRKISIGSSSLGTTTSEINAIINDDDEVERNRSSTATMSPTSTVQISFIFEEAEQKERMPSKAASEDQQRIVEEQPEASDQEIAKRLQDEFNREATVAVEEANNEAKQQQQRVKEALQRQKNKEEMALEQKRQARREYWKERVEFESMAVAKLVLLMSSEFCRSNPAYRQQEPSDLIKDKKVKNKLETQAKQTMFELHGEQLMGSRVVVVAKGSEHESLDGRVGTVQRWDENKGKLFISLDSTAKKKNKKAQNVYILPDHVQAISSKRTSGKRKTKKNPVSLVSVSALVETGESLMFEINKETVDKMLEAPMEQFLVSFRMEREDERLTKQREEEAAHRAEKMRQENEERERQRLAFARCEELLHEILRERHDSNHEERERVRMFYEQVFGGRPSFGSQSGSGFFNFDDDDDDDDAGWDDFGPMNEEEQIEKNAKAAELLGVDEDASEDTINRVFRKLSLKYHPDRFCAEKHEEGGTTRDDCEEHFKRLSDARDVMLLFRERNKKNETRT